LKDLLKGIDSREVPWIRRVEEMRVAWQLLVVRPHPQNFHHSLVGENLIHEPMLDVYSSRHGAVEIAHQSFEGRWILEGIAREEFEKQFDPGPQG